MFDKRKSKPNFEDLRKKYPEEYNYNCELTFDFGGRKCFLRLSDRALMAISDLLEIQYDPDEDSFLSLPDFVIEELFTYTNNPLDLRYPYRPKTSQDIAREAWLRNKK